jgi:hypothetical protein
MAWQGPSLFAKEEPVLALEIAGTVAEIISAIAAVVLLLRR